MPSYFKDYGERLVELGYTVVPINPGTKACTLKDWRNLRLTADDVRRKAANGSADAGIGINSWNTPLIDVDVMDPDVAQLMSDFIDTLFPNEPNLMSRTGKAPKFGVPTRSATPFRKISSGVYTDGKHDHKVEILGDGQQWVAYAVHPDTGRPYQYCSLTGDVGIVEIPHEQLPELGQPDAIRIVNEFERLASLRVQAGAWRLTSRASAEREPRQEDPFASHAEPVRDLSRAQIEWLLRKLNLDDRDGWLDAGMILHHQFEASDEGFDFWVSLSENHEKFDADDQKRVWESFGHGGHAPKTLRAVIAEHGQPPGDREAAQLERDFRFYPGDSYSQDFAASPEIVEDVLPSQGTAMMFGPSGKGKTFWALDLAFHVHNGVQWRDKDVVKGDVMYVAAEAGRGIKKRIQAVRQVHPDWQAPFIADAAPNLSSLESIEQVRDAARAAGSPAMLVIDTLSASFEGDDSSQQDVAKMIRNLKILADDLQCLVMFVHHTTKEGSSWRGSGVLYADVDAVLELVSEGDGAARKQWVTQRKHREGEDGKSYPFTLRVSQPLAHKANGKPITSCYVEHESYQPVRKEKSGRKSRSGDFETAENYRTARIYLRIIEEMAGMGDANIDENDVISALQSDRELNPMGYEDKPAKRSIQRTLHTLGEKGKISREGRWIKVLRN